MRVYLLAVLALTTAPLAAQAQQAPPQLYRIGLSKTSCRYPTRSGWPRPWASPSIPKATSSF